MQCVILNLGTPKKNHVQISIFIDGAALASYVNQIISKGIANMRLYQSKVVKQKHIY